MDVEPTLHDAAFVDQDRGGTNIAGHDACGLKFCALRGEDVASDRATDDDLTRGDVANDRRALSDDDKVRAADCAFQSAVNAKGAVSSFAITAPGAG